MPQGQIPMTQQQRPSSKGGRAGKEKSGGGQFGRTFFHPNGVDDHPSPAMDSAAQFNQTAGNLSQIYLQ